MHGYLSADIICSEKRTVFRERSLRKTVSYEEQVMSKDKYPSIFLPQMEAIVFIILQIFFATRAIFKIGEYINNSRHLAGDIICSEKRTVFRERSSRKTVSYEEQVMSKDKYPSIFSPQMEAIVFIILQIFFATRAIFKIGEYSRIFHSFGWGIFGHVTCLGQSRESKKI